MQIPDGVSLPFPVPPSLKRRLEELQEDFGVPDGKRPRAVPVPAVAQALPKMGLEQLRQQAKVLAEGPARIGESRLTVLQVYFGDDLEDYFFYLANETGTRLPLSPMDCVTSGTKGVFHNRLLMEHEEEIAAMQPRAVWPFRLSINSAFRMNIGGVIQYVRFPEMYSLARRQAGTQTVTVYAHSVADLQRKRSLTLRAEQVRPLKHVDIVMSFTSPERLEFAPQAFGHLFRDKHITDSDPLLQLAWPVQVIEPGTLLGNGL